MVESFELELDGNTKIYPDESVQLRSSTWTTPLATRSS